jgi:uncharacterized membrane protein YkoI
MQKLLVIFFFSLFSCTAVAKTLEFPAGVSLDDAVKQLNAEKTGKVLSTKTETVEGKKFYLIKILTGEGIIQYIKIDVQTGKVVE